MSCAFVKTRWIAAWTCFTSSKWRSLSKKSPSRLMSHPSTLLKSSWVTASRILGKIEFVINETLESPDDSSVENVERLRGNGLHFVELAGKRKQALVRQGGKPLTCG